MDFYAFFDIFSLSPYTFILFFQNIHCRLDFCFLLYIINIYNL
nr:MAG TPA: hypothetical protein [Bacteriophage sp.]